jgi:hypothetical protein
VGSCASTSDLGGAGSWPAHVALILLDHSARGGRLGWNPSVGSQGPGRFDTDVIRHSRCVARGEQPVC